MSGTRRGNSGSYGIFVLSGLALLLSIGLGTSTSAPKDPHGGVPMGVKSTTCDDALTNLTVDWDDNSDIEYTCGKEEPPRPPQQLEALEECLNKEDIPFPLHECMSQKIEYKDPPPMAGPHRPLWPVYGEYLYVPPQRWVHSLEHGAAVFLYHPCAAQSEILKLKALAKQCLRRHIITPYRHLDLKQPLAIITYGCRLLISKFDASIAETFVKEHALKAPEWKTTRDGQYDWHLVHKADIVKDIEDSTVCPNPVIYAENEFPPKNIMIAENMIDTKEVNKRKNN